MITTVTFHLFKLVPYFLKRRLLCFIKLNTINRVIQIPFLLLLPFIHFAKSRWVISTLRQAIRTHFTTILRCHWHPHIFALQDHPCRRAIICLVLRAQNGFAKHIELILDIGILLNCSLISSASTKKHHGSRSLPMHQIVVLLISCIHPYLIPHIIWCFMPSHGRKLRSIGLSREIGRLEARKLVAHLLLKDIFRIIQTEFPWDPAQSTLLLRIPWRRTKFWWLGATILWDKGGHKHPLLPLPTTLHHHRWPRPLWHLGRLFIRQLIFCHFIY